MIKDQIIQNLQSALEKLGIKDEQIILDSPNNLEFGDYATSIALKLAKKLGKNPMAIAQEIIKDFPKDKIIENINIVKPGFINFKLTQQLLLNNLNQIKENKIEFEHFHLGPEKKIMVEFAHPNTHKLFHIGHLRNISIGESIVRILETAGNKVVRTNYQGDVGLHIAKCLWYIKNPNYSQEIETVRQASLLEKIEFLGKAYSKGQQIYEEDEKSKKEILEINKQIYEQDPKITDLWKETRSWSLEYYDEIYKRVYSHFDRLYFESELAKRALEIVDQAQKNNILEKSDGAIIFNGKKYGIDTRVFVNSQGFPTYEGKELALAEKEFSEFGNLDKVIHVVTPEQKSFFKVTFKVEELLDEQKYKDKQYHLAYEWVKLKTGKMSSRTGNVIAGDWLIDHAKEKIIEKFKLEKESVEPIAIASVKYSFLKQDVYTQIAFDFDESISLEGNSGPYLLYTFVRTLSVLKKAESPAIQQFNNLIINKEELDLLRALHQYSEVVKNAAIKFAPNLITNYLFDLAQKFNLFYQKYPILKTEKNLKNLRLNLTQAVGIIIKHGLYLLGIETVEKM